MPIIRALFGALTLLLLLQPAAARAQAYTSGSSVTRVWTTTPTVPSITATLPADSYEPADVADSGFTESAWILTGDALGTSNYKHCMDNTCEKKFRIQCGPAFAASFDSILGKGIKPFGHRHQFTGNVNFNENGTFTTNRTSPSSTCDGGPLWSTPYWEPELIWGSLVGGYEVGIQPHTTTFYYINGTQDTANNETWLRRDTAFIGGVNPADPEDAARRVEYAAAGLLYPGGPDTSAGFMGWFCLTNHGTTQQPVTHPASQMKGDSGSPNGFARHLKDVDGSDPWGGACTGTVSDPALLQLNLIAPGCWDATNLRAPDGRAHMAYPTRTGDSAFTNLCPNNWVHIPTLTAKVEFYTLGFAEYGNWYFSSDRMHMASPTCPDATAACPASKDACRQATINSLEDILKGSFLKFIWYVWTRVLDLPSRPGSSSTSPATWRRPRLRFSRRSAASARPSSPAPTSCGACGRTRT
jgi:hypothetical protein